MLTVLRQRDVGEQRLRKENLCRVGNEIEIVIEVDFGMREMLKLLLVGLN